MDALATAQVAEKEAKEQLSSIEKKHRPLGSSLLASFNKAEATREEKTEVNVSKWERQKMPLKRSI